jgi:hypothetical protein
LLAAAVQGCAPESIFSPPKLNLTAARLNEVWRKCVISKAETMSRSPQPLNIVILAAYEECRSQENALLDAYSAMGPPIMSEDGIRQTTRASIREKVVSAVLRSRKGRPKT